MQERATELSMISVRDRRLNLLKPFFAFAALLFIFAGSAKAQLVTNGGFETGDFSGWTGNGGGNVVCNSGIQHSGNCAAQMFCCASLSQNITTTPGGIYTLDFWFRNPQASISVSWNGTLIFSASAGAASEYTHKMFPNLAATTNSTPLTFSPSGGVGAG